MAREKVHYAATIAGMAFANAFLGVCHSMAHKLGAEFHLPHGLAIGLLVANVVRYNANDNPTKQSAFSQYDRPKARCRYAEIAESFLPQMIETATPEQLRAVTEAVISAFAAPFANTKFAVERTRHGFALQPSLNINSLARAMNWMFWQDVYQKRRIQFCVECGALVNSPTQHAKKFCSQECAHRRTASPTFAKLRTQAGHGCGPSPLLTHVFLDMKVFVLLDKRNEYFRA